jgi:tape measure domain-containing protein
MTGVVIDIETKAEKAKLDLKTINRSLADMVRNANNSGKSVNSIDTTSLKNVSRATKANTASMREFGKTSNESIQQASKGVVALAKDVKFAKTAVMGLAAGFAAFQGIQAFRKITDDLTNVQNRLKLVTKEQTILIRQQRELFKISQEARADFSATVNTYVDFNKALEKTNISQKRIMSVAKTIQQAGKLSGSSTESVAAGMMQLGQGISSGVIRGEEFNSVMEQMKYLGLGLAKSLNMTSGQLRTFAGEGKLTTEILVKAVEKMRASTQRDFDDTALTATEAFKQLGATVKYAIADFGQYTQVSSSVAKSTQKLTNSLTFGADSVILRIQTLSQAIKNFKFLADSNEMGRFSKMRVNIRAAIGLDIMPFSNLDEKEAYAKVRSYAQRMQGLLGKEAKKIKQPSLLETVFNRPKKPANEDSKFSIANTRQTVRELSFLGIATATSIEVTGRRLARLMPVMFGPLTTYFDQALNSVKKTKIGLDALTYKTIQPLRRGLEAVTELINVFEDSDGAVPRAWVNLFQSKTIAGFTDNLNNLNRARERIRWNSMEAIVRGFTRNVAALTYPAQEFLIKLGLLENSLLNLRETRLDRLVQYFVLIKDVAGRLFEDIVAPNLMPYVLMMLADVKTLGKTVARSFLVSFNANTGKEAGRAVAKGLAAGFELLKTLWMKVQETVKGSLFKDSFLTDTYDVLKRGLAAILSFVTGFFKAMAGQIAKSFSIDKALDKVVSKIKDFGNKIKSVFYDIWDKVVGHSYWPDMIDDVVAYTKNIFGADTLISNFRDKITKAFEYIEKVVNKSLRYLQKSLVKYKAAFKDFANLAMKSAGTELLGRGLQMRVNYELTFDKTPLDEAKGFIAKLMIDCARLIDGGLPAIEKRIKRFGKAIKGEFYDIWDKVVGHSYWPDMIDGVADYAKNLFKSESTVSKFKEGVVNEFKEISKTVSSFFNGAQPSIKKLRVKIQSLDLGDVAGKLAASMGASLIAAFFLLGPSTPGVKLAALSYFAHLFNFALDGVLGYIAPVLGRAGGEIAGAMLRQMMSGFIETLGILFRTLPELIAGFVQGLAPEFSGIFNIVSNVFPIFKNKIVAAILGIGAALIWLDKKNGLKTITGLLFDQKATKKKEATVGLLTHAKAMFIDPHLPAQLKTGKVTRMFNALFAQKAFIAAGVLALSSSMFEVFSIWEAGFVALPLLAIGFLGKDGGLRAIRDFQQLLSHVFLGVVPKFVMTMLSLIPKESTLGRITDSIQEVLAKAFMPDPVKVAGPVKLAAQKVMRELGDVVSNFAASRSAYGKGEISFKEMLFGKAALDGNSIYNIPGNTQNKLKASLGELFGAAGFKGISGKGLRSSLDKIKNGLKTDLRYFNTMFDSSKSSIGIAVSSLAVSALDGIAMVARKSFEAIKNSLLSVMRFLGPKGVLTLLILTFSVLGSSMANAQSMTGSAVKDISSDLMGLTGVMSLLFIVLAGAAKGFLIFKKAKEAAIGKAGIDAVTATRQKLSAERDSMISQGLAGLSGKKAAKARPGVIRDVDARIDLEVANAGKLARKKALASASVEGSRAVSDSVKSALKPVTGFFTIVPSADPAGPATSPFTTALQTARQFTDFNAMRDERAKRKADFIGPKRPVFAATTAAFTGGLKGAKEAIMLGARNILTAGTTLLAPIIAFIAPFGLLIAAIAGIAAVVVALIGPMESVIENLKWAVDKLLGLVGIDPISGAGKKDAAAGKAKTIVAGKTIDFGAELRGLDTKKINASDLADLFENVATNVTALQDLNKKAVAQGGKLTASQQAERDRIVDATQATIARYPSMNEVKKKSFGAREQASLANMNTKEDTFMSRAKRLVGAEKPFRMSPSVAAEIKYDKEVEKQQKKVRAKAAYKKSLKDNDKNVEAFFGKTLGLDSVKGAGKDLYAAMRRRTADPGNALEALNKYQREQAGANLIKYERFAPEDRIANLDKMQKRYDNAQAAVNKTADNPYSGNDAAKYREFETRKTKELAELKSIQTLYEKELRAVGEIAKNRSLANDFQLKMSKFGSDMQSTLNLDFGSDGLKFLGTEEDFNALNKYRDAALNIQAKLLASHDIAEQRKLASTLRSNEAAARARADQTDANAFYGSKLDYQTSAVDSMTTRSAVEGLLQSGGKEAADFSKLVNEFKLAEDALKNASELDGTRANALEAFTKARDALFKKVPLDFSFENLNAQLQAFNVAPVTMEFYADLPTAQFEALTGAVERLKEANKAVEKAQAAWLSKKGSLEDYQKSVKELVRTMQEASQLRANVTFEQVKTIAGDKSLNPAAKLEALSSTAGINVTDALRGRSTATQERAVAKAQEIADLEARGPKKTQQEWNQLTKAREAYEKLNAAPTTKDPYGFKDLKSDIEAAGVQISDLGFARLQSTSRSTLLKLSRNVTAIDKQLSKTTSADKVKKLVEDRAKAFEDMRAAIATGGGFAGSDFAEKLNGSGLNDNLSVAKATIPQLKTMIDLTDKIEELRATAGNTSNEADFLAIIKKTLPLEAKREALLRRINNIGSNAFEAANTSFGTSIEEFGLTGFGEDLVNNMASVGSWVQEQYDKFRASASDAMSRVDLEAFTKAMQNFGEKANLFASLSKNLEDALMRGTETGFAKLKEFYGDLKISAADYRSMSKDSRDTLTKDTLNLDALTKFADGPLNPEMKAIVEKFDGTNQTSIMQELSDKFKVEMKAFADSIQSPTEALSSDIKSLDKTIQVANKLAANPTMSESEAKKAVEEKYKPKNAEENLVEEIVVTAGTGTKKPELPVTSGSFVSKEFFALAEAAKARQARDIGRAEYSGPGGKLGFDLQEKFGKDTLRRASPKALQKGAALMTKKYDLEDQILLAEKDGQSTVKLQKQVDMANASLDALADGVDAFSNSMISAGQQFAESVDGALKENLKGVLTGKMSVKKGLKGLLDTVTSSVVDNAVNGLTNPLTGKGGILTGGISAIGRGIFGAPAIGTPGIMAGMPGAGAQQMGGILGSIAAPVTNLLGGFFGKKKPEEGGFASSIASMVGGGAGANGEVVGSGILDAGKQVGGILKDSLLVGGEGAAGGLTGALKGLFSGGGEGGISAGGLGGLFGSLMGALFLADGGPVRGPGTSTSDSIPVMGSDGEFMVNARAYKEHGPLVRAINGGKISRSSALKLALGGPVTRSSQPGAGMLVLPSVAEIDQKAMPSRAGGQTVINLGITGDISRQTRKEIYGLIPQITSGVNSANRESGYKG